MSGQSSLSHSAKDDKSDDENVASRTASNSSDAQRDVEKGPRQDGPVGSQTATQDEAFLVQWDENDNNNPRNWSPFYKAFLTFQYGMLALCGSMGSSIISPASEDIAHEFDISRLTTVLCVSLNVLGFALGPCLWAPISEVYGRKLSMLPAIFVLALFSIGSAISKTAAALFLTRFFAGVFGSAPISNVPGALGDLYEPRTRGIAVAIYAIAVAGGPTAGIVIGAALTAGVGWRWTEYFEAIWTAFFVFSALITMPEIFPGVLLKRKAQRLRKETGNNRYWHPHEQEKIRPYNAITKYLTRPLRMLVTEPIITCIALYAAFVYGLLYMTLEIFPIVYGENRGWGLVVSSLPFLGILVGVVVATGIIIGNQPRYIRAVAANNGRAVPEARLPPMILGGWLFVIGLFWFAWTARPSIHWAVPTIATVFIGAGFISIFQNCTNFLVDIYGVYGASAVAAQTILRSFVAFGLPLATRPMIYTLGVGPGISLIGAIASLALPMPFLFRKYGAQLRRRSKFAPAADA